MDSGVGREGEKGGLRRVTPEKYEGERECPQGFPSLIRRLVEEPWRRLLPKASNKEVKVSELGKQMFERGSQAGVLRPWLQLPPDTSTQAGVGGQFAL